MFLHFIDKKTRVCYNSGSELCCAKFCGFQPPARLRANAALTKSNNAHGKISAERPAALSFEAMQPFSLSVVKNIEREYTHKMKSCKTSFYFKILCIAAALVAAVFLIFTGLADVNRDIGEFTLKETCTLERSSSDEEYSEDENNICKVEYVSSDGKYSCFVNYTYQDWENLDDDDSITGYIYVNGEGTEIVMPKEAAQNEIVLQAKEDTMDRQKNNFSFAAALFFLAVGIAIITVFSKQFTLYEKIWFISILALAAIFSIIFPEDDCNGISGLLIMILYLADTFLNVLCELLISKQSKWNFLVSVFVEIVEILICVVLSYRFATMASTLFFWLPCDIISFINWHRHPDREDKELTCVRTLKGWQEVAIIAGIAVWTVGVGYFLSGLSITSDLFSGNEVLSTVVCYLDACVSAVGICNGLFILLRFREQWIAWYISAAIETVINILSGQYVLLVLKAGYFTNTTYGYIKWTKYIQSQKEEASKEETSTVKSL